MLPIRIVLTDENELVHAGSCIQPEKSLATKVGKSGDEHAGSKLVEAHSPDVILMDITTPAGLSQDLIAKVAGEAPSAKIIVLSMHGDPESVLKAVDAGAAGYILKDASIAELRLAIDAVMRGKTYLTPSISRDLVDEYRRRRKDLSTSKGREPSGSSQEEPDLSRLTPRQREILRFLVAGASTRRIASMLNLSVKTVETHRAQVMERLGIRDLASLVRFAIRAGLVRVD